MKKLLPRSVDINRKGHTKNSDKVSPSVNTYRIHGHAVLTRDTIPGEVNVTFISPVNSHNDIKVYGTQGTSELRKIIFNSSGKYTANLFKKKEKRVINN